MKPLKQSVAVVIRGASPGLAPSLLTVRRPVDDAELPDIWGLPAATLRDPERWEEAVRRLGHEKLGVRLAVVTELHEGTQERPEYLLHMKLFEARVLEGEPDVDQPVEGATRYTEWKWSDSDELVSGARKGSLCCRLFLSGLGRGWD